jgi:serine phosphatase RsbU (regulator of sigma subunit)
VVFCSDGIIEAEKMGGEIFGFERTEEIIGRSCGEGLSPTALIERVIDEVKSFSAEVPQGDDQTIVVVAVGE